MKIAFLLYCALFLINAFGEPYDPKYLMSAGYGYFPMNKNSIEVSEWFNTLKIAGIESHEKIFWLGFDQGYYLHSPDKIAYFETQFAYLNFANSIFPVGVSAGIIKTKVGFEDWRGSIWISLPFIISFTGSVGFETFNNSNRTELNLGLITKVPIYACCNVLGTP